MSNVTIQEKAEALRKKGKKVLTLRIRQQLFGEIMAGTKKEESREITPTTENKYIELDEDGYAIEDKERPVSFFDYMPAEIKHPSFRLCRRDFVLLNSKAL